MFIYSMNSYGYLDATLLIFIIIFCKIGASQLDTPVTTLDRITITYTCANNRIHFFPIRLGIGNSIREFHYHCTYNCDPGIIK